MSTIVFENRWGEIIDRPGVVEIRWFDSTADMTGDDFNAFLTAYVEAVENSSSADCFVDATAFRMPMEKMSMGWRDENIVPRYNAAGVTKFAFHMPTGMPAIGTDPAPEGPATFPTAYFGTREDAMRWLG